MHWAITGATGFLGVHILGELLRGDETFTLLTRPQSDPITRIQKALPLAVMDGQVWAEAELRERLAVVPVDLAAPKLGLSDQRFRELADSVDAILHCAGSIELDADLDELRRTNVGGTTRILELAEAGAREPDLFHVSTAFVAGKRRTGLIYETELGGDKGFENNYEQSKFEAESIVRNWARRTGRRVVVLRPSALIVERAPHPDFPLHPLSFLSTSADSGMRLFSVSGRPLRTSLSMRLRGDFNGHLNYMPADEAADEMVRLMRLAPDGLSTYHVVHHHDVAVQTLVELFNAVSPIPVTLVEGPIENPNLLERRLRWASGFFPYLEHSRTYDTTDARAVIGEPHRRTVVDFDYLLGSVGRYKRYLTFKPEQRQPRESAPLVAPLVSVDGPFDVTAHSADAVRPTRGLTFIVTVGRSGSTALSRILSAHPDVLSLNEFYLSVRASSAADHALSGEQFWRMLAEPHPIFDSMVRGGSAMPEFIYPRLQGSRFDANTTGIPAISMMTLPHLSPDPDGVFDALAAEVPTWPRQTSRLHFERLFAWLATHFGGTVVVERSAMSLSSVPWLRETFPDAKFVHLFRNGPDTAVSMSEHTGFRLMALIQDALELLDLDPERRHPGLRLDPTAIPIELASLVGETCDVDYLMSQNLPITRFARMWSELIVTGEAELANLPADRYLPLSYLDLVTDTRSSLARLASFLDVEANPKWLDYGIGVIDPRFSGASTRLSGEELRAVVESCAPGAARLAEHAVAAGANEITAAR
ncbi:SDR family oxidoreductase [Mycobacterium sp. Aquia_216]|uniref:SDR family oxidoreductase n=1 Tax=Mycobacterium sp. Aquia_216 TaxID=2991729 RepID=UPI00227B19A5|nr:SDR family oxidoreductase [Mycobacterium sp. Aquia_216]WAJ46675.1 SDR family oxidoreductase [Mycobacterium sp. Aquia_216]